MIFINYKRVVVFDCSREDADKTLMYGSEELPLLECLNRLRLEEIQRVESGEKRRFLKLSDITKHLGENEVPCEIRNSILQRELGTRYPQIREDNGYRRVS